MDAQLFQRIGLTDGETKVYLSLLKLGSTTTGPLVDDAHVSRSKIYHILQRLLEKGFVTSIIKAQTRYFQAADPQKLLMYLEQKEKELAVDKEQVKALLPKLELQRQSRVIEDAEIYQGFEGIKTARELVFKVLKRGDTFYCLGANKINLAPLAGYWQDFHHRRNKLGIKARYLIQEDSRAAFSRQPQYQSGLIQSRYLDLAGPVHIDIFGDYVVTCILQGTATSFLIRNKFVADYYRSYFEKAWKAAKK